MGQIREGFVDLVKDFGSCSKCNAKLMNVFEQMLHKVLFVIEGEEEGESESKRLGF